MKKLLSVFALCLFIQPFFAQVTTTVNPTIAQLQQKLSGNGITISNVSITCPNSAYALYSNGTGVLSSLTSGILLTTGTATTVSGSNIIQNSKDNFSPGTALGDLLANSGLGTQDACFIKFTITPTCNTLSINYVFASEEYPEYSEPDFFGDQINDVFGFVIDGPNPSGGNYVQKNIALIPGTSTPVSIANVNNGNTNTGPCVNCAYYQNDPAGILYDGSTTVLTASTAVAPCSQYTMTIGVWDDADGVYDSGVFLDVNGISCSGSPTLTAVCSQTLLCSPQTVTLSAGGGLAGGTYTWVAPASGGTISATGPTVTATPTANATYTLNYSDVNSCPGLPLQEFVTVTFTTSPAFPVAQSPTGNVCVGSTATLTANGGSGTYTWSAGTTPIVPSGSVVTISPTITTTYTVTKTTGSTCPSSTVITVNVSSPSPITITATSPTICAGTSATLSTTGSAPFTWTASSGANPPSTQTVVVTPSTTTNYTVLTGTGSCTAIATTSIGVVANPTINVTPSSTTICFSSNVVLTANGATTYTWLPTISLSSSNGNTVTATPSVNTTYTITGTANSCTSSVTASVSVTNFTTNVAASSNTYCIGGASVTLTASGANTYSWSPSNGLSSTTNTVVTASPTLTTTYTLTGTLNGCTTNTQVTITVPPTVSLSATTSNSVICANAAGTVLFAGGASTYTWMPGNNHSDTYSVTPITTTVYTLTGNTSAGCITVPSTITIQVNPNPNVTITPTSTTICNGGFGTNLNALGASNYTWMPAAGISNSLSASVIANPTVTTTYTIVGAVGSCTNTTTATVNVITVSTNEVASSYTYCVGGPSVTVLANGATNYTWSATTWTGSVTGNSIVASPSITTTYTLKGVTGPCSLSKVFSITVPPIKTITTSATQSLICLGATNSLSVTGASTYTWANTLQTDSTIIVAPTTTTDYTVFGQTSEGCYTFPAIITISVSVIQTPTIVSSQDTVCPGEQFVLSEFTNDVNLNYSWTPVADIFGVNNTPTVTAQPSTTANVTYTLTTSNGVCAKTDTILIRVLAGPPDIEIIALNDTNICTKGCVSFSVQINKGATPITYNWSFPSGLPNTDVSPTPESCYLGSGSYDVKVIATNRCGTDIQLKSDFITVVDSPSVVTAFFDTIIKIQEFTTINATGANTYQWFAYPDDETLICTNCQSTVVHPTVTTNYVVYGYNSPNCWRKDTVTIIVDDKCGDLFVPNVFSPNNDNLNDKLNVSGNCILSYQLQVFNRWGERVFVTNDKANSWDGTFKGKTLDVGVYVYRVDGLTLDSKPFVLKGNVTLLR